MSTVADDLDLIQSKLHDGGKVWPRAELLRLYADVYRDLLAESAAVRRVRALDMPGRVSYAITQEWEDRHAARGTVRKFTRSAAAGSMQTTALWEAEAAALSSDIAPMTSTAGFSQEWERLHVGDSDHHYRFAFPRNHERIVRLEWNNRKLHPVAVREFDESDSDWMRRIGEPQFWTTGVGRITSVEVYEILVDEALGYQLLGLIGLPRRITGTRTYVVQQQRQPSENTWAYTTPADAKTFTEAIGAYAPTWTYTHAWERDEILVAHPAAVPAQFGINLLMLGDATMTVVHPWELQHVNGPPIPNDPASPGKRGMWPHERLDPDLGFESKVIRDDTKPRSLGLGRRITLESEAGFLCTQPWEVEQVDGDTVASTGAVVGCYPFEEQHGAEAVPIGLGTVRRILSPDRQYLGVPSDAAPAVLHGRVSDWRSSESSLLLVEVVIPDLPVLEADTPALIPAPMQKYLRYGVLARCFARAGEGRQPILADHYQRRFRRGVEFFRRLADVAHKDRTWQREAFEPTVARRLPYVKLPSAFPRVL